MICPYTFWFQNTERDLNTRFPLISGKTKHYNSVYQMFIIGSWPKPIHCSLSPSKRPIRAPLACPIQLSRVCRQRNILERWQILLWKGNISLVQTWWNCENNKSLGCEQGWNFRTTKKSIACRPTSKQFEFSQYPTWPTAVNRSIICGNSSDGMQRWAQL